MKSFMFALFLVAALGTPQPVRAVEFAPVKPHKHRPNQKYCDEFCHMQSQDAAFSLLMETYRQFQSYLIQRDYEARMHAAEQLGKEKGSLVIESSSQGLITLRNWVRELARAEHDLRMEMLETQVANFHVAYDCVRKDDEEEIGMLVPSAVDTKLAAERLASFVIVAPGPPAANNGNWKKAVAIPASLILRSLPAVAAPKSFIEPCD